MVDLRRREFITLLGGRSGGLIRQIDACCSQLSDSKASIATAPCPALFHNLSLCESLDSESESQYLNDNASLRAQCEGANSMDGAISAFETPQDYVATHPITLELTKRGVTDEQLAAIGFRGRNPERSFDQWSFSWGSGTPPEAIPFMQAYCTLKWLVLEDPPSSRDKDDAWRYINDVMIAPVVAIGLKHKEEQRQRAKRPRGKITDDGQTLYQILEALVLKPEHQENSPRELWPHFSAELDRLGLDPKEISHSDRRKIRYEYRFCGRLTQNIRG